MGNLETRDGKALLSNLIYSTAKAGSSTGHYQPSYFSVSSLVFQVSRLYLHQMVLEENTLMI